MQGAERTGAGAPPHSSPQPPDELESARLCTCVMPPSGWNPLCDPKSSTAGVVKGRWGTSLLASVSVLEAQASWSPRAPCRCHDAWRRSRGSAHPAAPVHRRGQQYGGPCGHRRTASGPRQAHPHPAVCHLPHGRQRSGQPEVRCARPPHVCAAVLDAAWLSLMWDRPGCVALGSAALGAPFRATLRRLHHSTAPLPARPRPCAHVR